MVAVGLAAVAVMALFVKFVILAPKPPAYDAAGCQEGNVQGHLVVILDRTDPLAPGTHRSVSKIIAQLVADMQTGDKLSVYEIDSTNLGGLSRARFEHCRPRDGSHADPLFENPTLISRRFMELFDKPLHEVIDGYQGGDGQSSSPIMECLMDVMHLKDFGERVPRRRLVVFSDLLQHTARYSHYRTAPDFRTMLRDNALRQMVPDLSGVRVSLYYLLRASDSAINRQTNEHVEFWLDYFSAAGAVVDHVEKVR